MKTSPHRRYLRPAPGFTLMEILVVVAVILVLLAIAMPVVSIIRQNGNKAETLTRVKKLGDATKAYVAQNDQKLPKEDVKGADSWAAAADPANANVWYNALPKLAGSKSVGEYASNPSEFYTPSSLLFVPGADYPIKRQLTQPYFAIAINSKLSRKDAEGGKADLKMSDIENPRQTVLFMEQGLPGEARSMDQQSKKDYDGASKGSPKSFVARYRHKGWLLFADGHAEDVAAKDVLSETGRIPYPQTDIIWTRTANEDPNKADDAKDKDKDKDKHKK